MLPDQPLDQSMLRSMAMLPFMLTLITKGGREPCPMPIRFSVNPGSAKFDAALTMAA